MVIIAVMFTFSFGSAFAAYTPEQLQNVVDTHEAAVKAIQDLYAKNLGLIEADYTTELATPQGGAPADAWKVACDAALEDAKDLLNGQLATALNALATAEEAIGADKILGWDLKNASVETNYVDVKTILTAMDKDALGTISADKAVYEATLEKITNLVKNYDLTKFVTDDDYNSTGKSSYQTAVEAQTAALKTLATLKFTDTSATPLTQITAIYNIVGVGTVGETESGSFYDAIKVLKTTTILKTDEAKIAYAKNSEVAKVIALIENERASLLKVENDKIFAETIATKPDQKVIDKANEEIEKINKQYDAYKEVWNFRLTNATYKVESDAVAYYYGTTKVGTLGSFSGGTFTPTYDDFDDLKGVLTVENAGTISADVADLKDQAATLKATIRVDGDVAIDVDAALADAVEETYMTGTKASISAAVTSTAVHMREHQLLGTDCAGTTKTEKVTVNGKKYDNVGQWITTGYSKENTKTVKAIIKEAKATIKAAATVADAEAAFLAAYEKYDAVLTTTEQTALFLSTGDLHKKDTAAKAELDAYIDYKVALMDDAVTGVAVALKAYYTTGKLTEEVNNEADLNATIAAAKATVDGLKTTTELKAADKALRDKIVALKRPVTAAQKDEVIALYDEYVDFDDYCTMVGYVNTNSDSVKALLIDDVKREAGFEKDAIDELIKAIEKDSKVTLEDRANVEAVVAAVDAYNALYFDKYATATGLTEVTLGKDYANLIFKLDVIAAEKLIAALPSEGATAAQLKTARDAVTVLGFDGVCAINQTYIAKLNRLEQNQVYTVETLKITASSTAKKGSITVTWTVKGDASAADGYQVWKSTKKSSGFKKAFTTSKKTYKNNKDLKKGVRYYYKVRAYKVVDGKNVYSDWSNKAIRIAK